MIDIMAAEPAELFVFGMTFYNDFSNIFRHDEDENMVNEDYFLNKANHHWGTELQAVVRIFEMKIGNLKVDAVLSDYLDAFDG